MKKRAAILSFAAIFVLIPIGHYIHTTRNEMRVYDQLLATVIPYANYSETSLSNAAQDIWARTQKENPEFVGGELIFGANVDPKVTLEYANCPSLEWFRDLTLGTDIHLIIDNRTLILSHDPAIRVSEWVTDRWIEAGREAIWRLQYSMRTWLNPPSENDPFSNHRAQRDCRKTSSE